MTEFSEPTTATGSTWIRCYSPDGYQMAVTLPITSVADALRHLADIRAAGLTATLPGLSAGELPGTITSCIKREKQNRDGSVTPIIDMYPAWEGEFGRYRFVGVYLNTPEDVAEFEANSGLKIKNMPLFESQVPLQRTAGITHKCEVACHPFEVVKKEDGMKEIGGKMMMTYELARYANSQPLATQAPAPVNAAPKAPIIPIEEHNFGHRAPDTRKPKADAAPKETMKGVELAAYVTVKVGATGPFYQFESSDSQVTAYSFQRAPFRNQGWAVDGWLPNEDGTPAEHDLDRFPLVDLEKAADGYWHVTHATAYQLCDLFEEGATA